MEKRKRTVIFRSTLIIDGSQLDREWEIEAVTDHEIANLRIVCEALDKLPLDRLAALLRPTSPRPTVLDRLRQYVFRV